jgi:hypothetical protein
MIRNVSEYYEYIAAYRVSLETQSDFVWSDNHVSRPSAPFSTNATTRSPVSDATTPSLVMENSPASQLSSFSPDLGQGQLGFINEAYQPMLNGPVAERAGPIVERAQHLSQTQAYSHHRFHQVGEEGIDMAGTSQHATLVDAALAPWG